jgi:hypothetical protein
MRARDKPRQRHTTRERSDERERREREESSALHPRIFIEGIRSSASNDAQRRTQTKAAFDD